jgi:hypothetical protein
MMLHAEGVIKGLLLGDNPTLRNLDEYFGSPTAADLEAGI